MSFLKKEKKTFKKLLGIYKKKEINFDRLLYVLKPSNVTQVHCKY